VEFAEPELERSARRLRRVLWSVRACFYGGAALTAALLLTGGDERPAFAEGRTSQDLPITVRLQDDRPTNVGTSFSATCRPPMDWGVRWWSFDGKTARFHYDDDVLRVRETQTRTYDNGWGGERTYTLEARVGESVIRGTMRYAETLRHPEWPAYTCESGDVTFSAG
jgi:hypothetical protein